MARIGLLEIRAGNHFLSGLCKISDANRNRVTVFTTTALFSRVKEELGDKIDNYEWILKKENESTYSYLKRIEKICTDRIDLVIINTLRNWELIFFKPKCKMLAFTYDLNYWFRDTKSLSIYVKKLMNIKNILIRNPMANPVIGPVLRRIVLGHLDGVIVEYPPFKHEVNKNLNYSGKVYFFPKMPFEGIATRSKGTKIRFVVPGMIQEIRRDYRLLVRVFGRLFPKYGDLIGLDLIGAPIGDYGQSIISHCESFSRKGYDVFCPKEYVPPRVVEEKLTNADVIISPMQVTYRSGCVEETYTITKGTALFSEVAKYAKPCIVPHTFNVTDEVKTTFLTYEDENELERLLAPLISDKNKLKKLQEEALKNSEKFSLGKLHEAFDNMVEELL